MKGKRLVDVLDDHTVLGKNMAAIYDKFCLLYRKMEELLFFFLKKV